MRKIGFLNIHGHFYFNAQVDKNHCCLQIAYKFVTLVILNYSPYMDANGQLFEFLFHPRNVEEFDARRGIAPGRSIRMFDVQVKSF